MSYRLIPVRALMENLGELNGVEKRVGISVVRSMRLHIAGRKSHPVSSQYRARIEYQHHESRGVSVGIAIPIFFGLTDTLDPVLRWRPWPKIKSPELMRSIAVLDD
jgi:hypothetical protein